MTSPHTGLKKLFLLMDYLRGKVDKYLDVGCGYGTLTLELAERCKAKEIYGVDINELSLQIARSKGIKVRRVNINIEKLPYDHEYFDLITIIEVLEHLYNPDNVIEEAYRCLKRGGYLVVATPNLTSWLNRILVLSGYLPLHYEVSTRFIVEKRPFQRTYDVYGHIRLFTLKTLKRLLEAYNFKVIKVIGETFPYMRRSWFTKLLDSILSKRPSLSADIIVLAQKQ